MSKETNTPRTDAAVDQILQCADGAMDLQRFTRQLEIELAEAREEVEKLKAERQWRPIETVPITNKCFIAAAFGVEAVTTLYNSDPYCVWHDGLTFFRWPHKFNPTHWLPLPEAPEGKGESDG